MATSPYTYVDVISGNQCIGDSLAYLNRNFTNLDQAITSFAVTDSSTVDLTFNSTTRNLSAIVNDNSISNAKLTTNSVNTPQLSSSSVTNAKIAFDGGSFCFRNAIINGDMRIWQRGTSFTGTPGYTADRWTSLGVYPSTITQSNSVPAGFLYSLKLQRPASSSATSLIFTNQTIETANCYDLAGQQVTLSFWVRAGTNFSSNSSQFNVQLVTGTVADQGASSYGTWTGLAVPLASTLTASTTWTKYTITGTVASNVLEMGVNFYYTPTGTAGADDSIYITGVQLEPGPVATPFEYLPISTQLALCQRYCETLGVGSGAGATNSTTGAYLNFKFQTQKRTSSLTLTAPAGNYVIYTYSGGNSTSTTLPIITTNSNDSVMLTFAGYTGLVAGQAAIYTAGSPTMLITAEL